MRSLLDYCAGGGQQIANATNCYVSRAPESGEATAIYAQLLTDPVRASLEGAVNTMLTHGGANKPAEVVQFPSKKTKGRTRKS